MIYSYAEEIALSNLARYIDTDGKKELTIISARVILHLIKTLEGKENKTPQEIMWDKRREKYEEAREAKKVLILPEGKRAFHVVAPYNKEFIGAATGLGGVWKPRTRVWSFRTSTKEEILELCKQHYPPDAFEL